MTEQSQGQSAPESGAEQGQEQERTFTQADMNKVGANEKREGVNSVINRYERVESVEGLDQIVQDYFAAQDEAESDLEKLENENATLKEREKAALKLADDRLIGAELRTALMGANVPPDRIVDAAEIVRREHPNLAVEKDGTVSGLADAVQATLEPRTWLTEDQQQAPRRAADVSRQVAPTSTDPNQLHGQFLANLLGNNSP